VAIGADETAGELRHRLADDGAELMVRALRQVEDGMLACTPQSATGITYAAKIDKAETRLDWQRPAAALHNQICGLSPSPGAWCEFPRGPAKERIKVLRTRLAGGTAPPGTILGLDPLVVACGEGALALLELQRAGKKPVAAAEFLRGARLAEGSTLA
jgi:methionyl-tRNA formyltransferase